MNRHRALALLAATAVVGPTLVGCDRPLEILGDVTVVNLGGTEVLFGALALPDGKILATGRSTPAKDNRLLVVRFLANGELDPTFGGDPVAGVVVYDFTYQGKPSPSLGNSIAVQSDGRIIVGGLAWPDGQGAKPLVARLLSDGKLDKSFGTGGATIYDPAPNPNPPFNDSSGGIFSVAIAADDSIYAGGSSATHHADSGMYWSDWSLLHYTRDGAPDAAFGKGGAAVNNMGWSAFIRDVKLLGDGRIVVAGDVAHRSTGGGDVALGRFLPDGSFDPAFGMAGVAWHDLGGTADTARTLVVQKDGKYLVGGETSSDQDGKVTTFALARFDDRGTLDPAFGTNKGTTVTHFPAGVSSGRQIAVTGNGFWLGGYAIGSQGNYDMAMARYTADGILDPCPNETGMVLVPITEGKDDAAYAMVAQPDKTPVLAGNTGEHIALARFNNLRCGVTVRQQ